ASRQLDSYRATANLEIEVAARDCEGARMRSLNASAKCFRKVTLNRKTVPIALASKLGHALQKFPRTGTRTLVVAVPEIEIETSDALDKTWIVPRQPCAFDV